MNTLELISFGKDECRKNDNGYVNNITFNIREYFHVNEKMYNVVVSMSFDDKFKGISLNFEKSISYSLYDKDYNNVLMVSAIYLDDKIDVKVINRDSLKCLTNMLGCVL